MTKFSYLALGDSYTIGEAVDADLNFPSQTVALLRKKGFDFDNPEIIATTGWTTDELLVAIEKASPKHNFDLVTLLIGVNNQYRGYAIEKYKREFEELLQKAVVFAGNKASDVFVLSIPDWGATPFAHDRDREKIGKEIDAYNKINKEISLSRTVNYLDITAETRRALSDPSLIAHDGLHPAAKAYTEWAEKLSKEVERSTLNVQR